MTISVVVTFDQQGFEEYVTAVQAYQSAECVLIYSPIESIGYGGGRKLKMGGNAYLLNETEAVKLLKNEILEMREETEKDRQKISDLYVQIESLTKKKKWL